MQLPRYHRLRHAFYRLQGTRCDACDITCFPPRPRCAKCGARDLPPHTLNGTGTLYSFSRMGQLPRGFANLGPCTVGMVQLDDGPLIMTQLTDVEGLELRIGMQMEMVTRKLRQSAAHDYIVYGYKFRPLVVRGGDNETRDLDNATRGGDNETRGSDSKTRGGDNETRRGDSETRDGDTAEHIAP